MYFVRTVEPRDTTDTRTHAPYVGIYSRPTPPKKESINMKIESKSKATDSVVMWLLILIGILVFTLSIIVN